MAIRLAFVAFPALTLAAATAACSSAPEASGSKSSATATVGDSGIEVDGATRAGEAPAGCAVNSGFPGDSRCLAAPARDQGFQLRYGPKGYAPAETKPFVLTPGQEINDCYYLKTSNTTDKYISGYKFSMRGGSHHIIMNVNAAPQADGFATCGANDQTPGILGSAQTPLVDQVEDPAPENAGLAVHIPANSQAVVNFHVINTSTSPILREAWLNYYYVDPAKVKGIRGNVFLVGGLAYQITPGTKKTFQYSCSPDRPVRILSLAAHMHAATSRLTMYKVSNGQPTMVYEGYDWANPVAFFYDSAHKNTMPNPQTKTPGAITGALDLKPGESLQWECAVENKTNVTLTFRNEVYTGEMCIVGGTMVPADDPMNPYDFTCTLN